MEKFRFINKKKVAQLPKTAGVYALNKGAKLLYIGKAASLRERVKNHFCKAAWRDNLFINQVRQVGYIKTDSEIEALILEANLIKKYRPKYNVMWRDDKNYFYVGVTKEKLPRVFITHQIKNVGIKINCIGPFVDGAALKKTLRILRKVFPYYTAGKHPKVPCSWCHLGLCPGPNPVKSEYKKSIRNLIAVLKGKRKSVLRKLKREMMLASGRSDFEKAARIRDQITNLEKVLSNAEILQQKTELKTNPWRGKRVEAYDISNIQGKFATGSMVTFVNGRPDKNFYRKFKVKFEQKPNDPAMLKEVLTRRFQHNEWPFPDLILVDGGKAQLKMAKLTAKRYKLKAEIIALTKDKRHKGTKIYAADRKEALSLKELSPDLRNLIIRIDEEAHRFALSYHRKLMERWLTP